jgi:hypothetical protein
MLLLVRITSDNKKNGVASWQFLNRSRYRGSSSLSKDSTMSMKMAETAFIVATEAQCLLGALPNTMQRLMQAKTGLPAPALLPALCAQYSLDAFNITRTRKQMATLAPKANAAGSSCKKRRYREAQRQTVGAHSPRIPLQLFINSPLMAGFQPIPLRPVARTHNSAVHAWLPVLASSLPKILTLRLLTRLR